MQKEFSFCPLRVFHDMYKSVVGKKVLKFFFKNAKAELKF